jgi:hypothetical protein
MQVKLLRATVDIVAPAPPLFLVDVRGGSYGLMEQEEEKQQLTSL